MSDKGAQEFLKALRLLPASLRLAAAELSESERAKTEELRLRAGNPISAVIDGTERVVAPQVYITPAELQMVLELATRASVHSYAESIRQGFVTAEGGCRLGLCGAAAAEGGKITAMRRLSSICIRIPHEKQGCADRLMPLLTEGSFQSTLIVSPPGGGKTTLLRELIRILSNGGARVALADERGEVAGCFEGKPGFDMGAAADVLTGAPKCEGVYLLLRAMSPQIIAFDEITAPADAAACEECANCGVRLLATAHGGGIEDLLERPLYRQLIERKVFRRAVIIENCGGERRYTAQKLC